MKRLCVLVIGLVLLVAAPGVAVADTPTGTRAQAIQYVIARGLSQRGVPYTYGGGNVSGPSIGVAPPPSTDAVDPVAATPQPATPGLTVTGLVPDTTVAEPKVAGFDASGLMVYSFAGLGVKLPRSSGEQYQVGRKVLPSQALPGDMIFFGPDGTQSVALFLGDGLMLEASPPAVKVSPVRTNGMAPYLVRIIQ
jgi:cell wall-associated NlpC family hydrolase